MNRFILILIIAVFQMSCSLNPPDWIIGEWVEEKIDSTSNNKITYWMFTKDSICTKMNTCDQYFRINDGLFVSWNDKLDNDKYILEAGHVQESMPHYEVFEKLTDNKILYYITDDLNKQINTKIILIKK